MSDWQATSALLERGADALEEYDLYKACVSFAINGGAHELEARLTPPYRELLGARRMVKAARYGEVEAELDRFGVDPAHARHFELSGDRIYILALVQHRKPDMLRAGELFAAAAALYRQGNDAHRTLRALINEKICFSTLETFTTGELFFLKQRASSSGFHDLVGNIEKAAVTELLIAGELTEAANAARRAIEAYRLDGCPEDRAVAQALLAIACWLAGEKEDAREAEQSLLIRDGKVAGYVEILKALYAGQAPQLATGHPLWEVSWSCATGPRENSIPGRVLSRLRSGGAERDELIRAVWGEQAMHPSYAGRLYTAIKDLRGKYRIPVVFDGSRYRLE